MYFFHSDYKLVQCLDNNKIYCVHKKYGLKYYGLNYKNSHHIIIAGGQHEWGAMYAYDFSFEECQVRSHFTADMEVLDTIPLVRSDLLVNYRLHNNTGRINHGNNVNSHFYRICNGEIRNFVIRELGC